MMNLLVRRLGVVGRGSDFFKKVNGFEKERETRAAEEKQEEG
jgi:hypothetical protein